MFKGASAYQISKTAMNSLGLQYSNFYKDDGFTVLMISPGVSAFPQSFNKLRVADTVLPCQWLKTDLGSQYADLDVSVGAEKTIDIILAANKSQNGKFVNISLPGWTNQQGKATYDGAEIPW